MLNIERRTKILQLIEDKGKVEVNQLSRLFNTSEVTIRNDLKDLHKQGLVRRAHGGALRAEVVSVDQSLQVKAELHAEQKKRIGAAAAALVSDGDTIILDSGTTTQQIARHIKNKKDLKVITNGLNIAMEIIGAKDIQIILLGGVIRQNSYSVVGYFAEDMLKQLSADKCFLGVDAIDSNFGLSTPNLEESEVNKAMGQIADEIILVADSSKFGRRSLSQIIPLSEVNKIISDDAIQSKTLDELLALGVKVITV